MKLKLTGGALPTDDVTLGLLTNPDFLMVHARASNQTVIEYTQANASCTPKTVPKCDWMKHGWTKWSADLLPSPPAPKRQAGGGGGGGYGGRGWPLPPPDRQRLGTPDTVVSPLKVVLVVNVGHPLDTYPLPPWDGPNSTVTTHACTHPLFRRWMAQVHKQSAVACDLWALC